MSDKIRCNNETDLKYAETIGHLSNGIFVPSIIPDDLDFEFEFWAEEGNGARFIASRIDGVYSNCEKTIDGRFNVYIPLSRVYLGNGYLCRKLRLRFPGQGWENTTAEICIPTKSGYYLWDGPSDDYPMTASEKAIFTAAFKGQDGISSFYQIHTKSRNGQAGVAANLSTVIEGLSDDMLATMTSDTDMYRLCLMTNRNNIGQGRRWRIPMLPYEQSKRTGRYALSAIVETDTWWPVTGRITPWFRGGRKLGEAVSMTINTTSSADGGAKFKSTRSPLKRIGVALFKKTGQGGEGWTRISNIAYITLFIKNKKGPTNSIALKINI